MKRLSQQEEWRNGTDFVIHKMRNNDRLNFVKTSLIQLKLNKRAGETTYLNVYLCLCTSQSNYYKIFNR